MHSSRRTSAAKQALDHSCSGYRCDRFIAPSICPRAKRPTFDSCPDARTNASDDDARILRQGHILNKNQHGNPFRAGASSTVLVTITGDRRARSAPNGSSPSDSGRNEAEIADAMPAAVMPTDIGMCMGTPACKSEGMTDTQVVAHRLVRQRIADTARDRAGVEGRGTCDTQSSATLVVDVRKGCV